MRTTLPWRLSVFEKFPTRPQMVRLKRVDSEFPTPKVRDSFTNQFVADNEELAGLEPEALGNRKTVLKSAESLLRRRRNPILTRHVGQLTIRANINGLIR